MKPKIVVKSVTPIQQPTQLVQQEQQSKIVVFQNNEFYYDERRSSEFESLFDTLLSELTYESLDQVIRLEQVIDGGSLKPQNWKFALKGQDGSAFEGKTITGYIKFPNDYPKNGPRIFFDLVNDQSIYHANIYGDGALCIPLLGNWRGIEINLVEMIQAMIHIFENPNNLDPANKYAAEDSKEGIAKQNKLQAQYLEPWV